VLLSLNTPSGASDVPCKDFGTVFFGTPYERDFGSPCGTELIDQTQIEYDQYSQENLANAINWANQQVQNQNGISDAEAAALEAARAAEEAARKATEEAAAATLAAKLAAEEAERLAREAQAEAERIAAELAALQEQNPQPVVPIFDCSQPENMALPVCQPHMQSVTNADGSLNCANPINTVTEICMNIFKSSESGPLDCARPELQNMPVCLSQTPLPATPTAPEITNPSPEIPVVSVEEPEQSMVSPTPVVVAETRNESANVSPKVELPTPVVIPSPILVQPPTISTPIPVIVQDPAKKEEGFAEVEGAEEPVSASLQVKFSPNVNRFIVRIDSNLIGETLTVRATKKGAKPIRFTIETDEDGVGGIRTKTKLTGYTLTVIFNGEVLSKVRV
jgi:hypothetical protein